VASPMGRLADGQAPLAMLAHIKRRLLARADEVIE
jgi:hypothetical protein